MQTGPETPQGNRNESFQMKENFLVKKEETAEVSREQTLRILAGVAGFAVVGGIIG